MKRRSNKNSTRKKEKKKNSVYKVSLAVKTCCEDDEVDRISELADDILGSILSFLNYREATATKILSSRWGRLDSTPKVVALDFPFPLEQEEYNSSGYIQTAKDNTISDYISQTNHALDSYKGGQSIDKFKIDIPCVDGAHWMKWLEFALSKETEAIDICMIYSENYDSHDFYYFSTFMENYCRDSLRGLKFLKELSLSGVNLSSYDDVLTKFVALERLSIESPQGWTWIGLRGVRHSGWVSKLKHLNISNVARNSHVTVMNMRNLISLKCHGVESYDLYLHDVPNLVDVSIVNAKWDTDDHLIRSLYDVYDQLLRVHLYIRLLDRERGEVGINIPMFIRVEHMELDIEINEESSNHQLFPLVETCPFLEELEIKFLWSSKASYESGVINKKLIGRKARINELKTVRVSGYRGSVAEFEFVSHVVRNATNLKDLIVVEDEDGLKNVTETQPQNFKSGVFQHLRSVICSYFY